MNNPTEEQEQRCVASFLDAMGLVWCHVPNGGARHKAEGGKLKAQGVKRGVPDVLIFTPPVGKDIKGTALELKRRKGGRVSPEQRAWLETLDRLGWLTLVCHGADQAIEAITSLYGRKR